MVHEEDLDVGRELALDLTRLGVPAHEYPAVLTAGDFTTPYQAAGNQHVFRAVVPRLGVVTGPEHFARGGRHPGQHPGGPVEQHDVVIDHQHRHDVGRDRRNPLDGVGLPNLFSGPAIDCRQPVAIVEVDTRPVGRHRERYYASLLLPQQFTGVGPNGLNPSRVFVPRELHHHAVALVAQSNVLGLEAVVALRCFVDQDEEHALGVEDLLGGRGLVVGANRLAGLCVESQERGVAA